MGQTATEKIIASRTGKDSIKPGDLVYCIPDVIMGHDLTGPHAINVFKQYGIDKVKDPGKNILVQDHFQPAKDLNSAALGQMMRDFARDMGIRNYFEIGKGGISHNLMLEKGFILPGNFIAGADSHTLTAGAVGAIGYGIGATDLAALWVLGELWLEVPGSMKIRLSGTMPEWVSGKDVTLKILSELGQVGAKDLAVEFTGDLCETLHIADRITICNMIGETGATTALMPCSKIVQEWLAVRTDKKYEIIEADPDASYGSEFELDVSDLEPMVAVPHSPSDVQPVSELNDITVNQVFVGGCTNGSFEDLQKFADVLGDHKVASGVRLIVIPATQESYSKAQERGILNKIVKAGGAVITPTCGPCVGGHSGIIASGEVCFSTTNRNYRGRMGHPDSMVYLGSPAVAAASAVRGKITHPADID